MTDEPIPELLILGAQKAGTTALFEHLASHPAVIRPVTRKSIILPFISIVARTGPEWTSVGGAHHRAASDV